MRIKSLIFFSVAMFTGLTLFFLTKEQSKLPLIAIANYGPHNTLSESIQGLQDELARQGFIENKNIRYAIQDVGFDASLIPQMIASLKNQHPVAMVALTTPVAQFAKGSIKDIPIVYDAITDPLAAELIREKHQPDDNITGSSDQQNLKLLLQFAQQLVPYLKTVGFLYAPSEANDIALKQAMEKAAQSYHLKVLALPVNNARDVPLVMGRFKDQVEMIYVGASGPVQPTLPVIAAYSQRFRIPVFNVDKAAVQSGLVLASFGVNYYRVGIHAGEIVADVLKNHPKQLMKPIYPSQADHQGYINKKQAQTFGIKISTLFHMTVVE